MKQHVWTCLELLNIEKHCYSNVFLYCRSEGFALTGYDIPGCMEDGAWMPWENSSAVAVAAVAHPGLGGGQEFGFSPEIKSCARRGAWFDFLTFSSKSQEFGFSPEIKSCARRGAWFDFLNFTHEYIRDFMNISEIWWKWFFSWIGSKSNLPTSKYAKISRNFDSHPMENSKKNWNRLK